MSANTEDKRYVAFPEEYTRRKLNELYREIPIKDVTSRLLRKYFNAMANLYGIISLKKAKEILFSYEPVMVTEAEFYAFAEIARHECEGYYILGGDELYTGVRKTKPVDREIIDITLLDDTVLFTETKQSQQGKPYYIPNKKQMLLYADPLYCEDTPQKKKLMDFLNVLCGSNPQMAEIIFENILDNVRCITARMDKIFICLKELGISFDSFRDTERFVSLYNDFHNTARMPCNRGYTPEELHAMYPPGEQVQSVSLGPNIRQSLRMGEMDIEDLRSQLLSMELPNESIRLGMLKELSEIQSASVTATAKEKISRNAPYPCGSGKKYKRCCGK